MIYINLIDIYHIDCLNQWINKKNVCPLCMNKVSTYIR